MLAYSEQNGVVPQHASGAQLGTLKIDVCPVARHIASARHQRQPHAPSDNTRHNGTTGAGVSLPPLPVLVRGMCAAVLGVIAE